MKARLVWIVAAVAMVGCGIDEPQNARPLSFELRQVTDTTLPMPIALVVRTEPQTPCLSYVLMPSIGFGQDEVAVGLQQTDLPKDPCIASSGPYEFTSVIGFGPVVTNNPFFLSFTRAGLSDRYLVIVSDTAIDIAPLRSTFTHPSATHVSRVG